MSFAQGTLIFEVEKERIIHKMNPKKTSSIPSLRPYNKKVSYTPKYSNPRTTAPRYMGEKTTITYDDLQQSLGCEEGLAGTLYVLSVKNTTSELIIKELISKLSNKDLFTANFDDNSKITTYTSRTHVNSSSLTIEVKRDQSHRAVKIYSAYFIQK